MPAFATQVGHNKIAFVVQFKYKRVSFCNSRPTQIARSIFILTAFFLFQLVIFACVYTAVKLSNLILHFHPWLSFNDALSFADIFLQLKLSSTQYEIILRKRNIFSERELL